MGYMAKRIQMRKNRFLALQKMAEQKKSEMAAAAQAAAAAINANNDVGQDMHGIPKQTVRTEISGRGNGSFGFGDVLTEALFEP